MTSPSAPIPAPIRAAFLGQCVKELAATGLAHTVVRPGFMYGGPATTSMTGQWFAAAEAGKAVFYGDTTKRWSWIHVDDLADAYVRILADPAAVDGEIFVIAVDQRLSALDLQRAAIRTVGYSERSSWRAPKPVACCRQPPTRTNSSPVPKPTACSAGVPTTSPSPTPPSGTTAPGRPRSGPAERTAGQ